MRDIEQHYRAHGSSLLSYLKRSFGWCGCPEDLLQETFVQALRRQRDLAEAVSPRAWLFGIARHVGLTAARKLRPATPLDERALAAPGTPSEIADLREAIAGLPPPAREALELRLRDGLSYEEIAVVLEIPVGTVRSRLHSAMHRLRDAMEAQDNRS
jgi:RNA polymerase sigma-70 factor (ECF subfamily)